MRIFTYVIVHDSGSAPNYEAPAFTLAVCKPRIRLAATRGDLILAFAGRRVGADRHGVRWAGIVGDVLDFASYWDDPRFGFKKPGRSARPDNIYRPSAGGLVQVPNPTHPPAETAKDTGGRHVLVFGRGWRFGDAAPEIPPEFGLRMASGRRGHRVHEDACGLGARVVAWLDAQPSSDGVIAASASRGTCRGGAMAERAAPRRRC